MKWFIVLYTSSNCNLKILVVEERGKGGNNRSNRSKGQGAST